MSSDRSTPNNTRLAFLFPKNMEGQFLQGLKHAPHAFKAVKNAFDQVAGKSNAPTAYPLQATPTNLPRQVLIVQPINEAKLIAGAKADDPAPSPVLITLLLAATGLSIGLGLSLFI